MWIPDKLGNPYWRYSESCILLSLHQVHLAMVRYHEGGRFCEKGAPWDQDSAVYHLERAAMCGELEAIVALGQLYLLLPHHVLPEIELQVLFTVLFRFYFPQSWTLWTCFVNELTFLNLLHWTGTIGQWREQKERLPPVTSGCWGWRQTQYDFSCQSVWYRSQPPT